MVNIYSFSQMNEVAPLMDAKTFDYISDARLKALKASMISICSHLTIMT